MKSNKKKENQTEDVSLKIADLSLKIKEIMRHNFINKNVDPFLFYLALMEALISLGLVLKIENKTQKEIFESYINEI